MVDEADHAVIMDFGIARSTSGSTAFAMTVGAQVIGTVEYMSPEQARAETVDQRADLYAFGLILRDMLLGGRHAGATSGVTELMARMQQPPPSAALDRRRPSRKPSTRWSRGACSRIPRQSLPDQQASCCATSSVSRRAGRSAIAPHSRQVIAARFARPARSLDSWPRACWLAVALGAWLLRDRWAGPPEPPQQATAGPAITLAILPFRNASGDPTLDSLGSSLSQVLSTDARPVVARADGSARSAASGASGSPDRVECDARSGATGQRGRLHQRAARALGDGHAVRQRDSDRRDTAGSRPRRRRSR